MKKFFVLLLTAGIAGGAFAQDATKLSIKKVGTSKVAVASTDEAEGSMIVKIMDQNGDLIYRDRIAERDGYKKIYDLSQMEEGEFDVAVTGQSGESTSATVSNYIEVTPVVYSRFSEVGEDTYKLLISAHQEEEEIKVLIFDGGRLIHSEMVLDPQGLHKVYKVERPSGEGITFKVETSSGFEDYVTKK
ncbi:hypothetical protein [Algoriphagus sediminis]|uniref:Uncharacterized protein n=1 Tax=Algoriphagus sediminis TaxID=3057113 RepID=A0ABT7YEI2_9BACT|nr:hypothetical protein [Algoriphagus sediminis]MDN3204931.1 hypothetical protein [Algoriphagus sediminis]